MIKFRQKEFTIPEGHYTGTKDMDKVPGVVEIVSKSALGGAGIGAIASKFVKDTSLVEGAVTGAKYGAITGIILKFFINYLHNPMSSIKYQDVDKMIRREFGIYQITGITVGDTVSKRATLDEKFSFNDRNVTNYKINFSVQDNQVTMYTFGMTDKELEKTSKILDYYCKKYFGMEYISSAINTKVNAYSVAITFTNTQVIGNFIMELSNEIGYKINLLDNKAIVDNRIKAKANEEEKQYSVKLFNKYELMKLLGESGTMAIAGSIAGGFKEALSRGIIGAIVGSLDKLNSDELTKLNAPVERSKFGNVYLEDCLKRLRYIENYDYTVGDSSSDLNISMYSGLFIITFTKGSKAGEKLEKELYPKYKSLIKGVDTGRVIVYSYPMKTRNEFEYLLKRLMSFKVVPNIFEK
jgi:hypothetical protein